MLCIHGVRRGKTAGAPSGRIMELADGFRPESQLIDAVGDGSTESVRGIPRVHRHTVQATRPICVMQLCSTQGDCRVAWRATVPNVQLLQYHRRPAPTSRCPKVRPRFSQTNGDPN